MKKRSVRGVSNFQFAVIILVAVIVFFIIFPRLSSPSKTSSTHPPKKDSPPSQSSDVPYVGAYHKGMSKAREIVAASKERNP